MILSKWKKNKKQKTGELITRPHNYSGSHWLHCSLIWFYISIICRKAYLSSESHGILIRTRSQYIPAREGIQALRLTWHWSSLERTSPVMCSHWVSSLTLNLIEDRWLPVLFIFQAGWDNCYMFIYGMIVQETVPHGTLITWSYVTHGATRNGTLCAENGWEWNVKTGGQIK